MFKVQLNGMPGWYDLRQSINGGPYRRQYFRSKAAAKLEAQDFVELSLETYRVVTSDVPEDWSPYSD